LLFVLRSLLLPKLIKVSGQKWPILVPAKAATICPALLDFPPDSSPLRVEAAGVAALRRGFPKSENTGWGRKMLFLDCHYPNKRPWEDNAKKCKMMRAGIYISFALVFAGHDVG
jgi:hypothetical protein